MKCFPGSSPIFWENDLSLRKPSLLQAAMVQTSFPPAKGPHPAAKGGGQGGPEAGPQRGEVGHGD